MSNDSTELSEDNEVARSNRKYNKSLIIEKTLLIETIEKERSKRKVSVPPLMYTSIAICQTLWIDMQVVRSLGKRG